MQPHALIPWIVLFMWNNVSYVFFRGVHHCSRSGPVQVHPVPLCHLPDTEMTHCTTGMAATVVSGVSVCSRITNQCQVKHKLELLNWPWWMSCCHWVDRKVRNFPIDQKPFFSLYFDISFKAVGIICSALFIVFSSWPLTVLTLCLH